MSGRTRLSTPAICSRPGGNSGNPWGCGARFPGITSPRAASTVPSRGSWLAWSLHGARASAEARLHPNHVVSASVHVSTPLAMLKLDHVPVHHADLDTYWGSNLGDIHVAVLKRPPKLSLLSAKPSRKVESDFWKKNATKRHKDLPSLMATYNELDPLTWWKKLQLRQSDTLRTDGKQNECDDIDLWISLPDNDDNMSRR